MSVTDLTDLVRRSLAEETKSTFTRRARRQADLLRRELGSGAFENEVCSIGLELEAYAVDEEGRVARVPDSVFETAPCAKELGLHNVEFNTEPAVFDESGIDQQREQVQTAVETTAETLGEGDLDLVLDAMWVIPPGEGTVSYLSESSSNGGITVASNMRPSARYAAIDNEIVEDFGGEVELSLPGIQVGFPSILVESLTTSVQPHLQVPDVETFPRVFNLGLRTLGPILSLATNSPFLPADLYEIESGSKNAETIDGRYGGTIPDTVDADPFAILNETFHELRIPVFEQAINTDPDDRKVRVPRDLDRPSDVVDRLLADRTCAPFLKEWVKDADEVDSYADRIWELNHKRGTYWRWLRPVVGGQAIPGVDERSLRLEYRPIPTQPTVDDTLGVTCLVLGAITGLVRSSHPVENLGWQTARRNFYRAVEDGLDAQFVWIDETGDRTEDRDVVFGELFEYARRGLEARGFGNGAIEECLSPIEARYHDQTTPSRWKIERVRENLEEGDSLRMAIESMQRAYIDRSQAAVPFVEW
ncbi:MAG: hypothetical protein ABEJ58_09440 [Halodesulfurarchaeum sp.]